MELMRRICYCVIGLICGLFIGYVSGCSHQQNKYEKEQLETQLDTTAKIQALEDELTQKNNLIVEQTIELNNLKTKQQKESIRYVEKIITSEDNSSCPIRIGSLRMYNDSIGKTVSNTDSSTGIDDTAKSNIVNLSDFTRTVIDNNYEMQKDIERFKALQEIVRNYQKEQQR